MRNVELSIRKEDTIDKAVPKVLKFQIDEIKEHYVKSINLLNEMFSTTDELCQNEKKGQAENIWRAQVILLVSAFDFFMHEITKLGVSNIFEEKWEKTQRYNNISMKLEVLDVALKDGEDNDWFIEFINEQFSKDTMVSYSYVKDQMNMLGLDIKKLANDTYYENGSTERPNDKLKNRLNGIYSRRNLIAHQSGRMHSNAELVEITQEMIVEYLDDVNRIVENIIKQVKEK